MHETEHVCVITIIREFYCLCHMYNCVCEYGIGYLTITGIYTSSHAYECVNQHEDIFMHPCELKEETKVTT